MQKAECRIRGSGRTNFGVYPNRKGNPLPTSLVSTYFDSRLMQAFYGIVVILMTAVNYALHKALEGPNRDVPALLAGTRTYCRLLLPDILIKLAGLVLALTVYPPIMMVSVLLAAAYILTGKHISDRKGKIG